MQDVNMECFLLQWLLKNSWSQYEDKKGITEKVYHQKLIYAIGEWLLFVEQIIERGKSFGNYTDIT